MLYGRRLAVVVPCFQVADHLPEVLLGVPDFVDHVIVVDDGSRDDLAAVVAAAHDDRIDLLQHASNRGVAAAMVTGLRRALERSADLIVKMDGDGQMDPEKMSTLLEPIIAGDADLTKGNRFLRRRPLRSMPLARHLGNLGLSFLAKLATGYWNLFDPTNGYIAMHRRLAEEIEMDRLGPRYYFEISLLCETYLIGAVARDVAIPARYGNERSSLSLIKTIIVFPFLLWRSCLRRLIVRYFIRDFTPVAVFLVAGTLLCGFGLGFGVENWMARAGSGQPTPTGTLLLALLPLLVGFQLVLQAVVMDIGNVPSISPWRYARRRLVADVDSEPRDPVITRPTAAATASSPAADNRNSSGSPGTR